MKQIKERMTMRKIALIFLSAVVFLSFTSCGSSTSGTIDDLMGKKISFKQAGSTAQNYILEKIDGTYVLSYVSDGPLNELDTQLVKGFVNSMQFKTYNIVQYIEDLYPGQDVTNADFAYALELFQKRQIGTKGTDKVIFYHRPYFYHQLADDGSIVSAIPGVEITVLQE